VNAGSGAAARILTIEAAAGAFVAVATSFGAFFAIKLGATDAEIALLSSLPALLALFVTIPAGRLISRHARPARLLATHQLAQRALIALIALAPLLPFAAQPRAVVALLILATLPAQVAGIAIGVSLADAIPETERARVVAWRSIAAAAVTAGGLFLAGRWLEAQPFPGGYQQLYALAFLASLTGVAVLLWLSAGQPPRAALASAPLRSPRRGSRIEQVREILRDNAEFARVTVNTLAHGLGLWLVAPLYVLYFAKTLGATAGWIGLNGTLASLTPIVGFLAWQRIVRFKGENHVLVWTITLIGLYPLLVGLTPNLTAILIWTALNGLLAPGLTVSHYPILLKICPAEQRALYLGIYSAVMGGFAFFLPLLGVRLAEVVGVRPVLIAGGLLCLLGSASFRLRPLTTPDSLGAAFSRPHAR
jgi:Na+/melibiose symporter-like transporter